jgi:hypothetical protein
VLISKYLSRFVLEFYYKLGKANIILDTLSCLLLIVEDNNSDLEVGELDILFTKEAYYFTTTLVKIDLAFKEELIKGYILDKRLS